MPGYVVALIVVALVFAPIAYVVEHGRLAGFFSMPNTPLSYVYGNLFLHIADYSVAGTLADVPYPKAWNGSLWSLYFEFLCYIVVGVVAIVPIVRTKAWPLIGLFAASVLIHAQVPFVSRYLGGNDFTLLMKLLPYFLGGAVVFVLKEKIPLRWYGALPALAVALMIVAWQPVWGGQVSAPLFTYVILWVASVLPSPRLVKVHDLSYGVYIYAFPVTQLLVLFGAHKYGLALFNVEIAFATLVLAALSWFLIERPSRDMVARKPVAAGDPRTDPVPAGAARVPMASATHVAGAGSGTRRAITTSDRTPVTAKAAAQPALVREGTAAAWPAGATTD
jgi:peptidoglycan/LPS O-acetylase OafA/YrhL